MLFTSAKAPTALLYQPGSIAVERVNAEGAVVAAAGFAEQRPQIGGCIGIAGGELVGRLVTAAGVRHSGCPVDQRPDTSAVVRASYSLKSALNP